MNRLDHKPSYGELEQLCSSLEAQVSRFIVVEQNLIHTRNELDNEISRFKLIQNFSEKARRIHDVRELARLSIEAVVEIFEVENSFILEVADPSGKKLRLLESHGLDVDSDEYYLEDHWFLKGHSVMILDVGGQVLSSWKKLDLHQMMACPLFGIDNRLSKILCAGISNKNKNYYEPLTSIITSSFSVLSRQIEGLYQNLQANKVIQRQVDELKALGQLKEQANRMKDEFLATLSHELRTPLNVIQGHVDLLLHEGTTFTPDQIKSSLDAIERSTHTQTQIISDLLDVSRIVMGKLSFSPCNVNIKEVIEMVAGNVASLSAAKGVELHLSHDPNLPRFIVADATRMQQIIWNLLSNAIKFTQRGGRIDIESQRVGNNCLIKVKDTGLGIEPAFLPYVFDRFKQEDSSSTRRFGGLGLGLSIVRHLTELHGGEAFAFSEGKGKGSEFTVTIPIKVGSGSQEYGLNYNELSPQSAAVTRLDGVRILLVDDSDDNRKLISLILSKAGAVVDEVSSAAEARLKLLERLPDVIVSDIGMPEEDGVMFIKRLRSSSEEEGGRIPAIALTAYVRSEEVQKILQAGFQTHVSKPVSRNALVHSVQNIAHHIQ